MPDPNEVDEVDALADRILAAIRANLKVPLDTLHEKMAQLDRRIAALPVPEKGEPGKDADTSAVVAQVIADFPIDKVADAAANRVFVNVELVEDICKRCVAQIVVPKGDPGKNAEPPSLLINDAGELVAVYADGETKTVGMVRGKDGNRGASVMDGAVDGDGQLTLRMSDGRLINVGVVRGKDGKDAIGKQGLPGRDATEIRVLPAIDEAKSYPEGTYALYRGGEIRAERTTDPITDGDPLKSGWRIAREGIAEESEQELDDGRVLERTTVYTSGKTFTRRHVTTSLIYRGIWKDGDFNRGDSVTWDGSLWHCERTTKDKPGASMDWKLVAKRGRDGKDAVAIKGDKGDKGDPGRDLTHMAPDGHKYS